MFNRPPAHGNPDSPSFPHKSFVAELPTSKPVPAGTWAERFRLMGCTGLLPTAKTTLNPGYGQLRNCLPNSSRLDDPITSAVTCIMPPYVRPYARP
jgi:hypothetical protein